MPGCGGACRRGRASAGGRSSVPRPRRRSRPPCTPSSPATRAVSATNSSIRLASSGGNAPTSFERRDVALRQDEEMRVRGWVDVAHRDEARCSVHVLALAHEAAEEAVRISHRRSLRRSPRAPARARTCRAARRRARASSRRRSRGRGGRRARRPRCRASAPSAPDSRCRTRRATAPTAPASPPRNGVSRGGRRPGPRASTGRRAPSSPRRPRRRATVRSNAALVLAREADDHVGRDVEAGLAERRDLAQVLRTVVAAPHGAQHVVVARLERDVDVATDRRCTASRRRRAAGRGG